MATILVVDDEPSARQLLVTLLGYAGHQVREAADGADALKLARAERPDLVITDLLMPSMSGFELVNLLRTEAGLATTPVVFYTASYLEAEARSLASACGVTRIITKPAEPDEVLRAVSEVLGLPPPALDLRKGAEAAAEPVRVFADVLARRAHVVGPRLEALVDLSLRMASEHDPRMLLDTFCASARKFIGARYAAVGVLDPAGGSLRHFVTSGLDQKTVDLLDLTASPDGILRTVAEQGRPIRLAGFAGGSVALGLPPGYPPVQTALAAPIASLERRHGWVLLGDKLGGSGFTEEEERLTTTLGALVGRIYENGSLYSEVERRSRDLEEEVAARRRAQEELARSESELRGVLDAALDAMVILDEDGRFVDANPAAETLFGRARQAIVGRRFSEVFPSDPHLEGHWQSFRLGGRRGGEFALTRPDGTVRDVDYRASAEFRPDRHLVVLRDVTEQRQLEALLRHSQKMEAVGRLAGGVAHDFNNMLSVITGHVEYLLKGMAEKDPLRRNAGEVLAAARRATGLTRQLLAFSRKQVLQPRALDLNEVVLGLESMLRRMIREDVELATRLDARRPVLADPGQLEQAVLNLAVNARDAMPSGGRLTIETRDVELDEAYARQRADVRAGPYVLLALSDTGHGMTPEVIARIFEPFFTTKEPGRGTGLGLASVYGAIKQTGGHVAVYSEPGRGTTFKLYLPPSPAAVPVPAPVVPKPVPVGGSETILLVEDEDALRGLAKEVLEDAGYRVLAAGNGLEALQLAQGHAGTIHLLLTDVVMPGMGGPELAHGVVGARPEARVLYVSGYADSAIVRHGALQEGVAFLHKPFSAEALTRKVREILDAPPAAATG